ncbi:hypothetical protein NUSPORA_01122 [Nucleospora cyclopteri]
METILLFKKHWREVLLIFAICILISIIILIYKRLTKRYIKNSDIKIGSQITIKVVKVGDGDGFKGIHVPKFGCSKIKKRGKLIKNLPLLSFRLAGIDAPEVRCFNKPSQPFSKQAKDFLCALILYKKVLCEVVGMDHYGRLLVLVFIKKYFYKVNVNLVMLKTGLACVYDRANAKYGNYQKKMIRCEKEAKKLKLGIWSLNNLKLPMDYKLKYKK